MAYETLVLTREERFAIITFDRPPANAISETLMRELNAALSDLEPDDAVRSVIITGAGDKIFCAGADLGSAFQGADVGAFIRFGNSVVRRIERFPKPVVAAINGHALGGGCEIAMGCHIRILKEAGMEAGRVSPEAVKAGALERLDVFVIGGGSGTAFNESLGPDGGAKVEAFVQRGGGVLGSCAGGYSFVRGHNDALRYIEVANAVCIDTENKRWARGGGEVVAE